MNADHALERQATNRHHAVAGAVSRAANGLVEHGVLFQVYGAVDLVLPGATSSEIEREMFVMLDD